MVIGGSGTGKSVLIKCILGLMEPDAGSIEIDGQEVVGMPAAEREEIMRKFGMLFQGAALFDSLPVWENVAFGLIAGRGMDRKAAKDVALRKLAAVGLGPEVGELVPAELSGGMQKRVAPGARHRGRAGDHLLRRADHRPRSDHGPGDQRADRQMRRNRWAPPRSRSPTTCTRCAPSATMRR